jgi:hypothetical protein
MASKIIVDQLEKTGGTVAALTLPVANASASQVLQNDGAGALSWVTPAAAPLFSSYAILQDQKISGTAGGTSTLGSWQTRDLQTEVYDGIGITISLNEFTVPAGTYLIKWSAPAWAVTRHQSRLYDVSGGAPSGQGSSIMTAGATVTYRGDTAPSTGTARVTVGSSNAYRIEHQTSETHASNGFGAAASFGVEVYTQVEIYKET